MSVTMSTTVGFTGVCSGDCACASGSSAEDVLQQCSAYRRAVFALETHSSFSTFRPGQLDAILPVLHGNDVFARIPTGGGKSLCMYIGVLAQETDKVGVIISPLIGLMDEQVGCMQVYSKCVFGGL